MKDRYKKADAVVLRNYLAPIVDLAAALKAIQKDRLNA